MTLASGLDAGASAGAHALARYRSEFPIFRHAVYLNTCSLGALGDRTRRRIAEFFDLWQARGASAWYDVWWAALSELRARYARVVGASPEEIALAPSVSVALSAVAEALDYRRRPKVVVTSLDFPTVAYQWLAKRARGVELVGVSSSARRRSRRSTRSSGASITSTKSASPLFAGSRLRSRRTWSRGRGSTASGPRWLPAPRIVRRS